jgi:hypothetical protein
MSTFSWPTNLENVFLEKAGILPNVNDVKMEHTVILMEVLRVSIVNLWQSVRVIIIKRHIYLDGLIISTA